MILGDICTRACAFCAVKKGRLFPVDHGEPARIANAVKEIGIKHAIITSVTRDDLPDGGADQFVDTVRTLREIFKDLTIELLVPDFGGNPDNVRKAVLANPDIFSHNMETIRRLYPEIRPGADYERSLGVLMSAKCIAPIITVKSGIMLGLGERDDEVCDAMRDIRKAGCDVLTIGQYLSPSERNIPVARFVSPDEFSYYENVGYGMGFRHVRSGPFVRSSYHAEEDFKLFICAT
jgi:lipoic acid synthetase